MTKLLKIITGFSLLVLLFLFACQDKKNDKETILKGKATLYVDESVFPIIEDAQAVFETQYNAKLTLVSKSENEIINHLLNDTVKIAVLPRKLSDNELKTFEAKKSTRKLHSLQQMQWFSSEIKVQKTRLFHWKMLFFL